jgi:DNA modification methylase
MSEIRIHCKYDEMVDPKKLKDHPKNRNKHDKDQIERLAKLYEYHGIRHPIIVSSRSKCIVAGHGRKAAAVKAGLKEMPVVYQGFDSEESEYAFIQADNAIALWAELDLSGINNDLGDLGPDFDVDVLGIKNFTVDVADKEFEADEDEVPEARPEPKVVRGEIYILGNHRLMCGDSTAITDVERLMNDEKADLCFTSPPYALGSSASLSGNKKISQQGKAYGMHEDKSSDWPDLMDGWWAASFHHVSAWIVNVQPLAGNKRELFKWINDRSNYLVDVATWDKGHAAPQMAQGVMTSRFEWMLIFCSENASRVVPFSSWHGNVSNVYSGPPQRKNEFAEVHGATMPTHLPEWAIGTLCDKSKSIYEPFAGTGTTMICSEKLGRKSFNIEIDPLYCGVILDRWQKFTGKKAHREDGIAWDEIKGE